MTYFDAGILGLVQGLTEFLPVSSSAHLVFGQQLLGVREPGITFEIAVHLGTLLSVLLFYRSKITTLLGSLFDRSKKDDHRLILYLVIATVPAAVLGIAFKDFFESTFSAPRVSAYALLVTACFLWLTRYFNKGTKPVGMREAIIMGSAQALAIFPGISRSGSTISAGMFAGTNAVAAAEFSFLMSILAVGGAVAVKAKHLVTLDQMQIGPYLFGAIVAFATGMAAVAGLLRIIQKGKFEYFAYYCLVAGIIGLIIF